MDKILTCKISSCQKYFKNPVLLPCNNNICNDHIDEIKQNNQTSFVCEFCKIEHQIPNSGFIQTQVLIEILEFSNKKNKLLIY